MFEERAAKVRIAHMVFLIQQNVLVAVSFFLLSSSGGFRGQFLVVSYRFSLVGGGGWGM